MKKLAVITSHPIQYNAPLFRELSRRGKVELHVFYTWGQTSSGAVYDPDFKRSFQWDIPLTEGYNCSFIENVAAQPGANHFNGIINKDLHAAIDRFGPDALLLYGWSFNSHLKAMRHYKGRVPILFRGDSTLLDEPPGFHIKKTVRRVFLKWVYKHIDIALYTGKANKMYFSQHGLSEHQMLWAPHVIDINHFSDVSGQYSQEAMQWRNRLGIPADAFVFLFAGKWEPKKNPLLLIKSFMKMTGAHLRLLLVGNGVLDEPIRRLALQDSRIALLDFQNQSRMPVVYRMANVFVLPSTGPGETWGLAVNEAMASGLSCIVSNKCGCAADLGTLAGNKVFESNDVSSLVAVMQQAVLEGPSLPKLQIDASYHECYSIPYLAGVIEKELCR